VLPARSTQWDPIIKSSKPSPLTSPAEEAEMPLIVSLNDGSGISVSSAGDVNGDGSDDLIIGAYGANGFAGKSFVVFGKNDTKPLKSLLFSPLITKPPVPDSMADKLTTSLCRRR
jgi:hypothetical protein